MSRFAVIETVDRPREGKVDFHLRAGREGRERVRVVLTKHNTYACMTCLKIDCVHSEIAREHFATCGLHVEPSQENVA